MVAEFEFVQEGAKLGNFIALVRQGMREGMPGLLMKSAQHASGTLRDVVYLRFPEGRTGGLARSWRETFLGRDGDVVGAAAHSELIYARILDQGGTIFPKTVNQLAIPFPGVKLPVGKWPRHFAKGELFKIRSRAGNDILMKRIGKKGKLQPMFVLKDSVTIKASNYIDYAANIAQPGIEEIMGEGLARIVDKGTT